MKKSRTIFFWLLLFPGLIWTWHGPGNKKGTLKSPYPSQKISGYSINQTGFGKLKTKAAEARIFVQKNYYNDSLCFLVDMSLPSSQNRFFVYDLKKDTIQNAGLVAHGHCNQDWLAGRKYNNAIGCGCTSLGKYKIGVAYNGQFGLAFKLYGLDKTNNNAFARAIVLHSHECVPEKEVSGEICESSGCPMVAHGFLQQLKPIIKQSKKTVLLWIYE